MSQLEIALTYPAHALAEPQGEYEPFADLSHALTNLGATGLDFHRWSPERVLAATVLIDALMQVRDRYGERDARHEIEQDLRWIRSENTRWPFSFVSLCDCFNLEPECVRAMVWGWIRRAEERRQERAALPARNRPSAKVVMLGRTRHRKALMPKTPARPKVESESGAGL